MEICGIDIRVYFLLFLTYSFLGWLMEVIGKFIQYKKFINRGFLIGPYCPIYGFGALLITFFLKKYIQDPIALFVMAIILCGILEYLTSYFMEKIFKARWWDYSNRKFNINGRVCLNTIIPFGLLGLFIMYVSNPFFLDKIVGLPNICLNALFTILFTVFIIDNIISNIVVRFIKKTESVVGNDLDNTEEMTNKVKEILRNKSILHRRLINAYPNFQAIKLKIKEKKEKIENEIKENTGKIKEELKQNNEHIKEKINEIKDSTK